VSTAEAEGGGKRALLFLTGLTKYFGGLCAVKDLEFEVRPHRVFGIIGPNGAGKTTVFNLISGVYPATGGQIVFQGEDITHLKSHQMAAKGVARTFQGLYLFGDMTVLENVLVGHHSQLRSGILRSVLRTPAVVREERHAIKRTREWLEVVGLSGKEDAIAGGLSYGEQIGVGIARALASNPQLLLLDEPAGGLTFAESERLMKLVETILERGITVLLIEHRMHFLMNLAHEVLVMDHGEKICQGTPEEVKRDTRVIEAYLGRG
jgi:branched-chain amino acid transport system ATP-binding protein